PTKFARIVVTDDRGRFVVPDLPKASYQVWVRGYGLVDSKKIKATPGRAPVRLKASIALNEGSAAQYYPPIYWYSMLSIPGKSEFPIGKAASQAEWLDAVKSNGCIGCHALGNAATRTVPAALGHFASSHEAWARRITSGQAMTSMVNIIARTDILPVLDPVKNVATEMQHPVRDPETPSSKDSPMAPSPYWGKEPIWDSHTTTHNPMLDERGRVWYTARIRSPQNPDFCSKGHP